MEPLSWARATNRLLLFEGKFNRSVGGNFKRADFTRRLQDTQIPALWVHEFNVPLHGMLDSSRSNKRHLDERNWITKRHKTHATGRSALFLPAGAVVPSQN